MHVTMRWPPPLRPGLAAGCSRLPHLRWERQKGPLRVRTGVRSHLPGDERHQAIRPSPCCVRCVHDARERQEAGRGVEGVDGRRPCSAAAGVRLAAVVRLRAASAELASFCLCHSAGSVPVRKPYRRVHLRAADWSLDDVPIALTFRARLRGLAARPLRTERWASLLLFAFLRLTAPSKMMRSSRRIVGRVLPPARCRSRWWS